MRKFLYVILAGVQGVQVRSGVSNVSIFYKLDTLDGSLIYLLFC